MSIGESQLR